MKKLILASILLIGASALWAQTNAAKAGVYARLEFYDNPAEIQISDQNGFKEQSIYYGFELNPGHTVKTGKTSAEIKLYPNGSIIKLSANTTLSIKTLQGAGNAKSNDFGVVAGKLRVIAAKSSGQSYNFSTPSAVAGVRGTDFGLSVNGSNLEQLVVRDGKVEFSRNSGGPSVMVNKGFAADALSQNFSAAALSLEQLSDFFQGLDFQVLAPAEVAGHSATPTKDDATNGTNAANGTDGQNATNGNSGSTAAAPDLTDPRTNDTGTAVAADDGQTPDWQKTLMEVLGIDIGSITIDGVTYGKAVLQPKIHTDGFKIGFYLPIIYSDNLLDPADWYKPGGNDEWSFGTDQGSDVIPIVIDAVRDLVIKIKYLEIGDYGDSFFLKIGSIGSMSLGHGMLINEYANDADFPAIRRLGTNMGIDLGASVFEVLVNDLSDPSLFGFRYLLRPLNPSTNIGIAISAAMDWNPASSIPVGSTLYPLVRETSPAILHLGADLDFPILKEDWINLKVYADFATVVPYLRTASPTLGLGEGFHFESVFDLAGLVLRNYGWKFGVSGDIDIAKDVFNLEYLLEFQYSRGAFQQGYYNQAYDRIRAEKAELILESMNNIRTNPLFDYANMGMLGSATADILGIVKITAAYRWPWNDSANLDAAMNNPDDFVLEIDTVEDKLPWGITVGISYSRSHFKEMLFEGTGYSIFDEFTTLSGGLAIPISDFFSLKASVSTATKRNSDGSIYYDGGGNPVMYPVLNIETQIGQ